MKPTELIWFNGSMVPWDQATVHVTAHALHYGSSVFEGIRAYETKTAGTAIFRLREHVKRLYDSAKIYRIPISHTFDEICDACRAVVRENGLASAYIRPLVYRAAGPLGVHGTAVKTETTVFAFEWGAYLGADGLEKGIDACVSSWRRASSQALPSPAKAGGHYLSSQLIVEEAKRHGYVEGIALDDDGCVGEGSGENVFVVQNGRLITPPLASPILHGITRDSVITLAKDAGIEISEQKIPRSMLYTADEVFMTGTAAEVTPIRSVDRITVGEGVPGPVTKQLQAAFFGLFNGQTPDTRGWLASVK